MKAMLLLALLLSGCSAAVSPVYGYSFALGEGDNGDKLAWRFETRAHPFGYQGLILGTDSEHTLEKNCCRFFFLIGYGKSAEPDGDCWGLEALLRIGRSTLHGPSGEGAFGVGAVFAFPIRLTPEQSLKTRQEEGFLWSIAAGPQAAATFNLTPDRSDFEISGGAFVRADLSLWIF